MPDAFSLNGSYQTQPTIGNPSGSPDVNAPIEERVGLLNKTIGTYQLSADSPVSVDFGSFTSGANIVIIKTIGGRVRARMTSIEGVEQAVPIDSFFTLICISTPITAIDLTRSPGVPTTVKVFLGARFF